MKLLHSNVNSASQADITIIGVPDESRSYAKRKGASKGPNSLRIASNSFEFFERAGKIIPICSMKGTLDDKKIFDYGNTSRKNLHKLIFDIASAKKIPFAI